MTCHGEDAVPAGGAADAPVIAIERLAAGGDGVGRIGSKVAFVPLTAPGDRVQVRIVQNRRNWCRAQALRILSPGPDRIAPPCPLFGACGGCDWQHVSYPAQLAAKQAIVADALRRIGRLDAAAVPTIPSPAQFGYRHRARLHCGGRRGAPAFGFFRTGSHEVVAVEKCPVLHPALNAAIGALARTGGRHPQAFARCLEVSVETGWDGGAVRLQLRDAAGGPLALADRAAHDLRGAAAQRGVRVILDGESREPLPLGPGPRALAAAGGSFTQVNLGQNLALVELALDLAAPASGEEALDLCCGLGNLALPVAARGARVTGVDLDAEAIHQARDNAARLGLDAEFIAGDAARAAAALAAAGRRFPLIMLNPPRGGAREAVARIPDLGPVRVVVVSCDPATLARDAGALVSAGYVLQTARPVDLFPQTSHVETVALFREPS